MASQDALFYKLLYPRQTCLVTSFHDGKANVNAVDWVMPVGLKPPMVAISINKRGLTHDLISESMEFVLAMPGDSMRETVANCAKTSGKFIDKIGEFNIKITKAALVGAPLLADAPSQMECKVIQMMDAGDHSLVVGEVVQTYFPPEERPATALLFNKGSRGYFAFQREWLDTKPKGPEDEKKDEKKADERKEERKPDEKKEEKKPDDKKEEKKDEKNPEEK